MLIKARALGWRPVEDGTSIEDLENYSLSDFFSRVFAQCTKPSNERNEYIVIGTLSLWGGAKEVNINIDSFEFEERISAVRVQQEFKAKCEHLENEVKKCNETGSVNLILPKDLGLVRKYTAKELSDGVTKFVATYNHACDTSFHGLDLHIVKIADLRYWYYTLNTTESFSVSKEEKIKVDIH